MTMNQTTIFHLSRSSLGLHCIRRSRLRPRRPGLPFSVWNSQLFTRLDCKSTEHNQGRVNVRVGVEPVILDNNDDPNEAGAGGQPEGASGVVNTGRIKLDASLHNTFPTLELASAPTESIDTSGPWYDVEEGRYIEEPASGLRPHEQHSMPSAPAQAQSQTLPQSPTLQQDQTNQQSIGSITRSTLVKLALYSFSKSSDSGDDRWTDENMAKLEKELGLALGEQLVESSSAGIPTSLSPRSVEALQDEIRSRERSEATSGRPEELRDASRRGAPAQGLDEWGQREARVAIKSLGGRELGEEAGRVEIRQQGELARRTALGDQ